METKDRYVQVTVSFKYWVSNRQKTENRIALIKTNILLILNDYLSTSHKRLVSL